MAVSPEALQASYEALKEKLDALDKLVREHVMQELADMKRDLALGEQSHATVIDKLNALVVKVDALVTASHVSSGEKKTWERFLDPVIKIGIGLTLAYIVFLLKLK